MPAIRTRLARPDDRDAIVAMQRRAVRAFGPGFYDAAQVESLAENVPAADPQMIADGSLFVAERDGTILGCAGFQTGEADYGIAIEPHPAPLALPCPGVVRTVFVDPSAGRQGLASWLMKVVEQAMAARGLETAELMATLPGAALYRHLGYAELSPHAVRLPGCAPVGLIRMAKSLTRLRRAA